jgi:hypothetical protein
MKQIFNMYRFVRLIDETERELELKFPNEMVFSGYDVRHPATYVIKKEYVKKYRKTAKDAHDICADAIKNGYLEGRTEKNGSLKVDVIRSTTEGRALIDKTLYILPIGLWHAWYEKFGQFILGIFVGLFVPATASFIKWLITL